MLTENVESRMEGGAPHGAWKVEVREVSLEEVRAEPSLVGRVGAS